MSEASASFSIPLLASLPCLLEARGEVEADAELAFRPFDPGVDAFEGGIGDFAAADVPAGEVPARFFDRGQRGGVFGVAAPGRHSLQCLPGSGEALFGRPQRRADFAAAGRLPCASRFRAGGHCPIVLRSVPRLAQRVAELARAVARLGSALRHLAAPFAYPAQTLAELLRPLPDLLQRSGRRAGAALGGAEPGFEFARTSRRFLQSLRGEQGALVRLADPDREAFEPAFLLGQFGFDPSCSFGTAGDRA